MNFSKIDLINDFPVAMYDCTQKKCVAIFKSKNIASKYVWGKGSRITSVTLADKKVHHRKNIFLREITFRTATKEQISLMKREEYFIILDDHFVVNFEKKEIILPGDEYRVSLKKTGGGFNKPRIYTIRSWRKNKHYRPLRPISMFKQCLHI